MSDFPTTTIVVPVYNAETSLEECIKSILDLDFPKDKLEIIFVDNNCSDKSLNIMQKYSDEITILKEKNQGPAAARNCGIKNYVYKILRLVLSF